VEKNYHDYQKELVELLRRNPSPGFSLLIHALLSYLTAINGYAELLALELKNPGAQTLENIKTLQDFNEHILTASVQAGNLLTDLRTEVRQQLSTEEGHHHD
jgi:hypothetical protein